MTQISDVRYARSGDVSIAYQVDAREARSILVSRPAKDLVAGSGLAFEDRGEHGLEGVPDRWQLYSGSLERRQVPWTLRPRERQ